MRSGFSPQDARDFWGDCLLKLWTTECETYDPNRACLRSWLYAVVQNLVNDRLRKCKNVLLVSLKEAEGVPDKTSDRKESGTWDWELIEKAKPSLSDSDQEVLELRYGQELTYAEMSTILGTSQVAAGMRVTRAVRRLRDEVERLTVDELRRRNTRFGRANSP